MPACLFASDLHGRTDRYEKLWRLAAGALPSAIFLGGDLLPHRSLSRPAADAQRSDFVGDYLAPRFARLRAALGSAYPRVFLILGNDDPRSEEEAVVAAGGGGLWDYAHGRRLPFGDHEVYGYACVPPTPLRLKDWDRYDVERAAPHGCLPPEQGIRTAAPPPEEEACLTIQDDLARLTGRNDLARAIMLFHTPPYRSRLDRAALDGMRIGGHPRDVHIGSVAVARLIAGRQPLVTLHGHVHESTRLTGAWRELRGRTWMFQAAHDGPELAVVTFDPAAPAGASRTLV